MLEKLLNFLWLLEIKWSKKRKADGEQVLSISVWGKETFPGDFSSVCVSTDMWGNYIVIRAGMLNKWVF